MSRLGNLPISVDSRVSLAFEDSIIRIKGPLGELFMNYKSQCVSFDWDDKNRTVKVRKIGSDKLSRSLFGTYRVLLNNMMLGVVNKFQKKLVLVGIGYRASVIKGRLDLSLGYSHNIIMILPASVEVEVESKKGSDPIITLSSIDKQLLSAVAAKIRSLRPPEPYKGKGVRYLGEEVRRKAGKSGK